MEEKNSKKYVSKTRWQLAWRKFKRNKIARVGLVIVVFVSVMTIFAPFFAPYDYKKDQGYNFAPPQKIHFCGLKLCAYELIKGYDEETYERQYEEDPNKKHPIKLFIRSWEYKLFGLIPADIHLFGVEKPGEIFLFGTDKLGRDLFSRSVYGGRISMLIALVGTIATTIVGTILGAISGYFGGFIDNIIQRLVELIRCFPRIPLWMTLSVAIPIGVPDIYRFYGIIGIIALLYWDTLAREVRGKVLSYREEDFIMAAKSSGCGTWYILTRHLIPMTMSHVIVVMTINLPWLIVLESSLSFLGLGVQPPMVGWGVLLQGISNLQNISSYPWMMIPGIFITVTVLGFNFLGDGIRDAADPFSQ